MASHRYWRARGLKPYDGGSAVELSELWLLNGATRVDSGATLASSVPPISGTLADLQDANPATMATLAAGSTITWDFGAATEVTNIQVGAGDSAARFLLGCAIERSDDGVTWREFQLLRNWMGIRWPGARALTANVLRVPPVEQKTIRMSFEPTVWQANEYGVPTTFNVDAGASALTVSPIQGARSVQFTSTGRLWALGHSPFSYAAGTDFTIQARVRATASTDGNRVIAAFGGINAGTSAAYLALNPNTKVLSVVVSGSSSRFASSPAGAVEWLGINRHVAASSENGTLRLFIDGVMVASSSGTNVLAANANPDLSLGNFGGAAANTFLGVIDEVGIDQKALYFNDFTPPAFIVPQSEWLIDAVTFAPTLDQRFAIPTADSLPLTYGTAKVNGMMRARPDFVSGLLGQGIGRVRGFTLDYVNPLNRPYPCRVVLMREAGNLVVREQWSKADGSYDFQYIDELQSYTVVAYYLAHGKRAVITDGLTLANGKVELMP